MLSYFKRKKEKKKIKSTFKEYGYKIKEFEIKGFGKVDYAQWLHPFEGPKQIELAQINFYKKLCQEGNLIIDIGAHTGDTTVPMALATGKNGLVIGLEPNPYVFKILEKNASLNSELTTIHALPFAATKSDGEFTFNYSDASFCNGGYLSQIRNQRHRHKYELKVQGKNFSKYLRGNYSEWLPKLDLLKVDAEGFDKDIIENLADIIAEYRPNIMAECYKRLSTEERTDLYNSMAKHDYKVYMNESEYLKEGFVDTANWVELSSNTMRLKRHFEIVAIPNK